MKVMLPEGVASKMILKRTVQDVKSIENSCDRCNIFPFSMWVGNVFRQVCLCVCLSV